ARVLVSPSGSAPRPAATECSGSGPPHSHVPAGTRRQHRRVVRARPRPHAPHADDRRNHRQGGGRSPSPRHVPSAFPHHRGGPGQGPRSANPVRTATSAVEGTDRLGDGGLYHRDAADRSRKTRLLTCPVATRVPCASVTCTSVRVAERVRCTTFPVAVRSVLAAPR